MIYYIYKYMGIFTFLRKKIKTTILFEDWSVLYEKFYFDSTPRENDFIYDDKTKFYYRVIKVIYPINQKNNICIVVTKLTNEINNHL